MSIEVEYNFAPMRTSGGRYHRVTTCVHTKKTVRYTSVSRRNGCFWNGSCGNHCWLFESCVTSFSDCNRPQHQETTEIDLFWEEIIPTTINHLFSPFRSFHRLLLTDFPALSYISTLETYIFALYLQLKGLNKVHVYVPLLWKSLLCISHCRECLPPYATKIIYGWKNEKV